MRNGWTLLEIAVVLLLALPVSAAAVRAGGAYRDRAAVLAAREGLVGLLARARLRAVGSGGATVHVLATPAGAWTVVDGTVTDSLPLTDHGVTLRLGGTRSGARLRFDALGLGRFTSTTVRFSRGGASAGVTVSTYGRVTRR